MSRNNAYIDVISVNPPKPILIDYSPEALNPKQWFSGFFPFFLFNPYTTAIYTLFYDCSFHVLFHFPYMAHSLWSLPIKPQDLEQSALRKEHAGPWVVKGLNLNYIGGSFIGYIRTYTV